MIDWLEHTANRRMPGLGGSDAPSDGVIRLQPLTSIEIDRGYHILVDWISGGWIRVDHDSVRSLSDVDGRDASSVDRELVEALWQRGLIRIDGSEPFSERQFADDLTASREYYTLVFILSPGCNLVCSYCYLGHDTPKRSRQFSVEEASRLFEQALALDYPGVLVDFGEFSVATELFVELLSRFRRRAKEVGVPVWFSAQTNGTTVDDDLCTAIAGEDLLLSISIDGPAGLHDRARTYRNGAGSHAAAAHAVGCARRAGIRTNLIATIGRHNVDHPELVVAELLGQQSDRYLLKPVLAHGEADRAWDDVGVTTSEFAAFSTSAFDAGLHSGVAGLDQTALKFLMRLCGASTGWRDACTSRWCGSGRDLHVVAADGGVHACPRFVDAPAADGSTRVVLGSKPLLSRNLLDDRLRRPHNGCEGSAWYRTCGGGCTLAGGLTSRDENCESYLTMFDRLIRFAVPSLLDDPAGAARSLGLAVRRLRTVEAGSR